MGSRVELLKLANIQWGCGTQTRSAPCEHTRAAYAEVYAEHAKAGKKHPFPPLVVFRDGKDLYPADGFHRGFAAMDAGLKAHECEVIPGTLRDALLYACGVNASHGLRRKPEDIRKVLFVMFDDEEWGQWSSQEISRKCHVSASTANKYRIQWAEERGRELPSLVKCTRRGVEQVVAPTSKATESTPEPDLEPDLEPDEEATDSTEVAERALGNSEPVATRSKPVDAWGVPIKQHANEAFAAKKQFEELRKIIQQARRLWGDLCELTGGHYLAVPGISYATANGWKHAGLETALLNLKDAEPALTSCPWRFHPTKRHGMDCHLCHGLDWTPLVDEKQLPPEMVAKAKEAAIV